MVGRTVLHYRLIEKIGSGGMGEIYKAQDSRLNRFVAIKALTAAKSGDADRRRRFIQEAQAASALNHPNIITIHDIIAEPDTDYLVMEFVAGMTLLDLIPSGGLRVPQVLRYSTQMADALAAAHAAGIIHRDFKPGNVMITSSGLVKVLDFGLAKLTDSSPVGQFEAAATVSHMPLTIEGSIMGTVSYMSPEQAEGKRVDARSDIFSFGAVLYEMVTGLRAFKGDSNVSTLSAVLRDDVRPISETAPDVPLELEQIIARCLCKKPDDRYQSMREVEQPLSVLRRQSDSGVLYRPISNPPAPPVAPIPSVYVPPVSVGPGTLPPATAPVEPAVSIEAPPMIQSAARSPLAERRARKDLIFGIVCVVILLAAVLGGWWYIKRRPAEPSISRAPATLQPPAVTSKPSPVAGPDAPPPPQAEGVLTNDNIIQLVEGKVAPSVIVTQIRSSKTKFNFSTSELIRLSKAGVPELVINTMRDPKGATALGTSAKPGSADDANPNAAAAVPAIPLKSGSHEAVMLSVDDGLPFRITLDEDVLAEGPQGQALRFSATEGLKVGDALVIAKGATVTGSITSETGKKKFLGMGGKATFRLEKADAVDGQKISVRAAAKRRTDGPTSRPLDTGKAKPKELAAAKGTQYVGYIDGQQTVSARK
jgi:serine/threonine protein kinase